jgi:hypothetical protein
LSVSCKVERRPEQPLEARGPSGITATLAFFMVLVLFTRLV